MGFSVGGVTGGCLKTVLGGVVLSAGDSVTELNLGGFEKLDAGAALASD